MLNNSDSQINRSNKWAACLKKMEMSIPEGSDSYIDQSREMYGLDGKKVSVLEGSDSYKSSFE